MFLPVRNLPSTVSVYKGVCVGPERTRDPFYVDEGDSMDREQQRVYVSKVEYTIVKLS